MLSRLKTSVEDGYRVLYTVIPCMQVATSYILVINQLTLVINQLDFGHL